MKKLLFAGTSFFAGHNFIWDDFCKEYNISDKNFPPSFTNREEEKISVLYNWIYKRKFNLAGQVGKLLQAPIVDLSCDGYSNTSVTYSIINYLSNLSKNERANYHAVVGWDDVGRFTKYDEINNHYVDVSVWWTESKNEYIKNFAKDFYKYYHNHDMIIDYIKNIIMVESFLTLNNVNYTFVKTTGPSYSMPTDFKLTHEYSTLHFFDDLFLEDNSVMGLSALKDTFYLYKNSLYNPIVDYSIIDNSKWYVFNESNKGWNGESWLQYLYNNKKEFYISEDNHHPNLDTIIDFSKLLSEKIVNDLTWQIGKHSN